MSQRPEFPHWPDYAELSRRGEGASILDDLGRSRLTVSVVKPYWTERHLEIFDSKTSNYGDMRFLCPLAGGGTSPHTLLAIYNLQGALDHCRTQPHTQRDYVTEREIQHEVSRPTDCGTGSLNLQRINRDWVALTVRGEVREGHEPGEPVSVFFNRLRSPQVYKAMLALGHAMRRDNRLFPRVAASQLAA